MLKKAAPEHLKSVRRLMIDQLTEAEVKAIGSAFAKIGKTLRDE